MFCQTSIEVIRVIERLSQKIKIVTFDVFDTLLKRSIMPPDISKIPAAKAMSQFLSEEGIDLSLRETLALRNETELKLRKKYKQLGMDNECHIKEILKTSLSNFMDSSRASSYADKIIRVEIEAEKSVCYPEKGMVEAVRFATELGKRVLFISDMYLGLDHISDLLDECGYKGLFHKGYLSSEYKLNKGSRRLFKLMLSEEKISPRRWLHFGDNIKTDVISAKVLGGYAYHFYSKEHREKTNKILKLSNLETVDSQWIGARWLELCRFSNPKLKNRSPAYQLGFLLLGPLLSNFIHIVIERIKKEKIQAVFFPAREGFMLGYIYKKLSPYLFNSNNVPFQYIFLNRKIAYLASINKIGEREITMGMDSKHPSLRTLLTRFSLNPEHFDKLAKECGIESLDFEFKKPIKNINLLRFFKHPQVIELIHSKRNELYKLLYKYLEQFKFWEYDKVAFIDVGWNGTVQDALTHAFADRSDWPYFIGLYLGFLNPFSLKKTSRSSYEGLLFHKDKHPIGSAPFKVFVELFELATRAPHASATALHKDVKTGVIIPVFNNDRDLTYRKEKKDRSLVVDLQRGIFDYADVYSQFIKFHEHAPEIHATFILNQLDRFLRLPKVIEGQLFEKMFHSEDFGLNIAKYDYISKPTVESIGDVIKYFTFIKKSLWPEGNLAADRLSYLVVLCNIWRIIIKRVF